VKLERSALRESAANAAKILENQTFYEPHLEKLNAKITKYKARYREFETRAFKAEEQLEIATLTVERLRKEIDKSITA
jgi:hypothetical protein